MKQVIEFNKKHWLTLGLLIAVPAFAIWLVGKNRAPGSMTVIEAQGMDMTTMRAPTGVVPVGIEVVGSGLAPSGQSFPAVVAAMTEEDVVARVAGRVGRVLVYPGDTVKAGQLLATLDAPEIGAEAIRAAAMAQARSAEALASQSTAQAKRHALGAAQANARASQATKARASTDAEAAALELKKSQSELAMAKAGRAENDAALTYAKQELARERELYKKGAISLDELQASQREHDMAAAKVASASAATESANQSVHIAEKRLAAARQMITEAEAQAAVMASMVEQARAETSEAAASTAAKRSEASAAAAETAAAQALAGYRELRALGDGEVAERVISPGTPVMAGMVVLKLKTIGRVRVQADLPQSLASAVHVGETIIVQTDGGNHEAVISSVFPTIDPATRTFRVEAQLGNADRSLKPGMFVKVSLAESNRQGLFVPASAVTRDDSGQHVWTVQEHQGGDKPDWTCTMHPEVSRPGPGDCPKCHMKLVPRERGGAMSAHRVTVSIRGSGDRVEVLTGLKTGDKVIWAGLEDLTEGTPVQPTPWGKDGPKEIPATTGESAEHSHGG